MERPRYKLGLIGAGKMGGALVRALLSRRQLQAAEVIAADPSTEARKRLEQACPGVTAVPDATATANAETLMVAVKPQDFATAVAPVAAVRPPEQLVVSVMAGVRLARLGELLGAHSPIIRVMPNIVCEVAEGAFGYATSGTVTAAQRDLVHGWLNSIGVAEELPEGLLDAVTGLSGSGPAFVALVIEALADGGVAAGLPRQVAQRLAAQTVLGAARWVLTRDGPSVLKDMVCSPAGTTIAGLRKLEAAGLRSALMEAVVAATERSRELGA